MAILPLIEALMLGMSQSASSREPWKGESIIGKSILQRVWVGQVEFVRMEVKHAHYHSVLSSIGLR